MLLALTACIEDRLSVELFTQVHADGSCTRRVEYRLERVDTDKGNARVAIPAAQDALRTLHRFPAGEPWLQQEEAETGLHVVVLEATLPSPNDVDGDYLRARNRRAPPARNAVSAYVDPAHEYYEYQEVFRDPASPIAGARLLSRLLLKREESFADGYARALDDARLAPRESDLRRAFREQLAAPFAREVAALAERPLFGPREKRELDVLLEGFKEKQEAIVARVAALSPGTDPERIAEAADTALNGLAESLLPEVETAGLALDLPDRATTVRFRATLVMPVPILRANTCAAGDTAVWEFGEDDLFGRGFEMTAVASPR
ncbi:MAG TPA: hypothetical protein VLF95_08620 [Vicinamibacteria bacterium]|nr:hypothetical protein [Vicinamibacteria bacterium]